MKKKLLGKNYAQLEINKIWIDIVVINYKSFHCVFKSEDGYENDRNILQLNLIIFSWRVSIGYNKINFVNNPEVSNVSTENEMPQNSTQIKDDST